MSIQRTTIGTQVEIPSYWKEEKYQPLVERRTLYGNKVMVPKRLLVTWDFWDRMQEQIMIALKSNPTGFLTPNEDYRQRDGSNIIRVYCEAYQE